MQLLQEKDLRELRKELQEGFKDNEACNMQGLLVKDAYEEAVQECQEGIMIVIAGQA
jgi:hypothetical protein